ncbi:hypothetical protein AK812_SmicGene28708 [Symbiodinium microadriaticum]|uniref:Uncharacterized protein n=1 Tax=Symbiodinium microadriaticum TaxID=2951 RepID=A0A1Q9D3M5_SYMMI|nr:hypothetical protein AK812_SmicGene28708 [Symbiodinium microadriaticum]
MILFCLKEKKRRLDGAVDLLKLCNGAPALFSWDSPFSDPFACSCPSMPSSIFITEPEVIDWVARVIDRRHLQGRPPRSHCPVHSLDAMLTHGKESQNGNVATGGGRNVPVGHRRNGKNGWQLHFFGRLPWSSTSREWIRLDGAHTGNMDSGDAFADFNFIASVPVYGYDNGRATRNYARQRLGRCGYRCMEFYTMQKAWVGEKMKASNTRACNAVVSKKPIHGDLLDVTKKNFASSDYWGKSEMTSPKRLSVIGIVREDAGN